MKKLYAITVSFSGYADEEVSVTACGVTIEGDRQTPQDFRMKLPAPEESADLFDWLRQVLPSAVEAL